MTREVDNSTLAETVLDTNISVLARSGVGVEKMDLSDLTLTSGRYQVMIILSSVRSITSVLSLSFHWTHSILSILSFYLSILSPNWLILSSGTCDPDVW